MRLGIGLGLMAVRPRVDVARAAIVLPNFTVSIVATKFAPSDISGNLLWLRADIGVTLVSGAVSVWADQSGNGNDFAQGTSSLRPTINATGISGLPAIAFDGVDDYVQATGYPTTATAGEVFMVMKLDADPPVQDNRTWHFGSNAFDSLIPFNDGTIYDGFGSTVRKTTVNPTSSLASPSIYSVRSASGAWSNHLNGTQLFSTGTNTVGWNSTPLLGASVSAGPTYEGWMAEVIIYDHVLSTSDRASVLGYLAQRYGVSIP